MILGLAGAAAACAAPAVPPVAPTSGPVAVVAAAGTLPAAVPTAAGAHPLTVDDMLSFERIGDPNASPDGKLVVFTVSTPDLAANKSRSDLWIAAVDGSSVRRLTSDPASDHGARFSADGKSVYFLSRRSGSSQVWRIAVDGGEATQVTTLPIDVDGLLPFRDGKRMLLVMGVFPEAATLDETAKREHDHAKGNTHVRAYDALPVRHWDAWDDGKRSHLFVWSADAKGDPIDLLKGLPFDAPPGPFGGIEEIAIAPNDNEVVFTSKMVAREAAWSTNSDLYSVPADGSAKPTALTTANPATDSTPVFSPDGTKLAYLAMGRPGFEADRQRIVVMDWKTKATTRITEAWDRSPNEIAWSRDGKTIFATADNLGRHALFAVAAQDGHVTTLVDKGATSHVLVAGTRLVFAHDSLRSPTELFTTDLEGRGARAITHINDTKVANVQWGEAEQISFTGAKGDKVYAWIVMPPGVAAGARVPVAFLVHGGPQGSFGDHFHYRWNPQAYAGHGYAAVMVDFHGSTGYGQAFTDAIRGDWGGAPFDDLMKGLDAALAHDKRLDSEHMAALGASYGGYMINWINGKTDRFKALVCHDGNLDETMAYFETEELWFPEWEHGSTPWENPEGYVKHSPLNLVKNWKTPTLVIHGGQDFRVVETQGLATFTALQRRGIPSRFLHFPDENHWVLKPAHSKRWHEEVLGWIDRYARGASATAPQ
jgi:dipeptidyl aminopeptidase/acylaminoacyl peptidase